MLIVGLGNPGEEYRSNRHNVGAMAIDEIARVNGFPPFRVWKRMAVSEKTFDTHKVLLAKTTSYMNNSGHNVSEVVQFLKIPLSEIIVIHDDIDLDCGVVKIKNGGGSAGHNGLKSIDSVVGQSYWRLRIGVGRPPSKDMVVPYVLGNFNNSERIWLNPLLESIAIGFVNLIYKDHQKFLESISKKV